MALPTAKSKHILQKPHVYVFRKDAGQPVVGVQTVVSVFATLAQALHSGKGADFIKKIVAEFLRVEQTVEVSAHDKPGSAAGAAVFHQRAVIILRGVAVPLLYPEKVSGSPGPAALSHVDFIALEAHPALHVDRLYRRDGFIFMKQRGDWQQS